AKTNFTTEYINQTNRKSLRRKATHVLQWVGEDDTQGAEVTNESSNLLRQVSNQSQLMHMGD
ncbi:hypothetical protein PIB30_088805, partial [Stylosanthes scabra]|nr:hypothetical protein [Stylosanthes scabra]